MPGLQETKDVEEKPAAVGQPSVDEIVACRPMVVWKKAMQRPLTI